MKRLWLIIVVSFVLAFNPALASTIGSPVDYGVVVISNNGTASATHATANISGINTASVVGFTLNNDIENTAIQTPSGADAAFMPGAGSDSWMLFISSVDASSSTSYALYAGNVAGGKIRYFPAPGGMTTGDSATLKLGDNFAIEQKGWVDTTTTGIKYLTSKSGAIQSYITSAISSVGDNFTAGTVSFNSIEGITWEAQTFSASANYITTGGSINVNKFGSPGTVTVSLRATSGGLPIGEDLRSGTFNGNLASGGWIDFTWSSLQLTEGATYALVVRAPSGDGANFLKWILDSGSGYLRGQIASSVNSGSSWTAGSNDYNFKLYGDYPSIFVTGNVTGAGGDSNASMSAPSSGERTLSVTADGTFFSIHDATRTSVTPQSDNLSLNYPLWSANLQGTPIVSVDTTQYSATVTGANWTSQGRTFDGNNDYITITDTVAIQNIYDGIGGASIVMWLKPTSAAAAERPIEKQSWCVYLNIAAGTTTTPTFFYDFSGNDLYWNLPAIPLNSWSQIVITLADTTAGTNPVTYKNGVAGGDLVQASTGVRVSDVGKDLLLGIRSTLLQDFNGTIGEFQIYHGVLTPTQVTALYNATAWKYEGSADQYEYTRIFPVTDNANGWTFFQNNVMPYMEYQKIYVGGNLRQHIVWQYNATAPYAFTDQSGNGNYAVPTFATTNSNAYVSAALSSFAPVTQAQAPAYAVTSGPAFITGNITATGNFTTATIQLGGPPGAAVVEDAATAGGIPPIWLWGVIAGLTLVMVGLFISGITRRYGSGTGELILRMALALIIIGLLVAINKFDWWMIIFYVFIALAPAMASRHYEVGANIGHENFVGFLAMSWIGLTVINRVMEAQFISAAETSFLNDFAFTQQFNILNLVTVPVINFNFISGLTRLFKWDYAFFGGNAQMIQYMLYTLNEIGAFILFSMMLYMLSGFITRR